jgi:hypothetical protein
MYNPGMRWIAQPRVFLALCIVLIAVGMLRSSWATRLDGFTIDEPWHITAGVAYFRTGEYYLNPEHPPLVKLVAALGVPQSMFRFVEPSGLLDKDTERNFVQVTMYQRNDADLVQARVRRSLYLFNGLLLLFFVWTVFRVAGQTVALGALTFLLIDPTISAHWPVVMTDLPVALLSVTSVLLLVRLLRDWSLINLGSLSLALGLTLSAKHSGAITFGFVALVGSAVLVWKYRGNWRMALRRLAMFAAVVGCAVAILWGIYGFRYYESHSDQEKFNRPLNAKIDDVRSPAWRFVLTRFAQYRVLPRPYIWGFADIIRTGMEGRAYSTLAFGRLTFMERRPSIFPGYILVKLPIALTVLALFGCMSVFLRNSSKADKQLACILLLLAGFLLIILAYSNAEWAGVRHAMIVCVVMAVMAGFGVRTLLGSRAKLVGQAALIATLAACVPALAVVRPWEYHNVLGGGTKNAYRYFRNDGVDVGQRDKEIAAYCKTELEPRGEVPWVGLMISTFVKPDLVDYRHVKLRALEDPSGEELPPATITGTILLPASATAPAIWSDNKSLRDARPVERMGTVLVYRGTYYLPNIRASALFDKAATLFAEPKPDLEKIEPLLKEGLALRSNDFSGWMMMGNLHLLRGEREKALAAYGKARDSTLPSPFRTLFDEQAREWPLNHQVRSNQCVTRALNRPENFRSVLQR